MSAVHPPITAGSRGSLEYQALWALWTAPWNGELALNDTLISPDFIAHAAPITGGGDGLLRGREGLAGWITGIRAAMPNLVFTTEVGPLADDSYVCGRWIARGTYQGGMPGAPDLAIGKTVEFTGTDIFRVRGNQIAVYWTNADILQLLQQLGVLPGRG